MLAMAYASGKGVPQDFKQAAEWFRKAAEQGDGFAETRLGFQLAQGQGVKKDIVEAYMWFAIALAGGYSDAQQYRLQFQKEISQDELDTAEQRAKDWRTEFDKRKSG